MPKKYKSGNRENVLVSMATCAIRDQQALIEAYTPQYAPDGCIPDNEVQTRINECQARIDDFERIAQQVKKNKRGVK